ncbi:MAG: AAA family ATPase [Patescibacteria group bacterium]|nr:AAA family ATPase [Patescibacteria group bacterium]
MKKTVIALVGEIGSGKGTIASYLNKKYKFKILKFSTPIREILNRLYLPVSRLNMQKLSTYLRKIFGQEIISWIITQDIKKINSQTIVIDGPRRLEDITYLKKDFNFYLIAIKTKKKIRYQRIIARQENPDEKNKTWEEFQKESRQESERKIRSLMKEASFFIDNNQNLKETYQQVDEIIKKILKKN